MRKVKLLSAALLAAATFATPALAATHTSRHAVTNDTNMASVMRSADRDSCIRAPDVGAYATQPWTVPPCEPNTGY
jgi:hypothetical protein